MAKKVAPRLSGWLLFTLGLCIFIALIAPHQIPITVYKVSLVTLGGVIGYWMSRAVVDLRVKDCSGLMACCVVLFRGICVTGFSLALSLAA